MKKSDITTGIGLLLGIVLLLWGMTSELGLKIFWDLQSLAITVGGSFAAVLITYSLNDVKLLFKVLPQSFKSPAMNSGQIIKRFGDLSQKARREGLLSLEDEITNVDNEFMKKGLQMVVDGIEPEVIRDILELEIDELESRHNFNSKILMAWATFAPAFGMVGTLIGLIQMLANMQDQAGLASGMAKALITTFYGSLIANLILIPMGNNLDIKTEQETANMSMMLEGILAIQSGVNPRIVEEKLMGYLSPKERLEFRKSSEAEVTENV
ncbi:chemotaxis protein MotA [Hathewaya proteolytica DSM 3090]|uniref:Chemotaxis protein MotA n=1 Tax=Hathewaya proteolytica DSM 3090 TaxID=1121331 RepID=A0A1M6LA20_9CLOT|nr:motility protein A [Hathewaya proteolytica]SHJ68003.1 chemotaxis protein MotA [Hathewaya proteolytica DSM 3090]